MGFAGYVRQHFGYGRGAWRFHRARSRRGTGKLEVEGSFYLACLRAPFRARSLREALSLAVLLGVWQGANTAGFFFEALRQRLAQRGAAEVKRRAGPQPFTTEEAGAGS
jgi:hypothetical protein